MDPSLGSARFDSVLTRVFKKKARLGSARSLSLKTQSVQKGQNESISDWRQAYNYIYSLNHRKKD